MNTADTSRPDSSQVERACPARGRSRRLCSRFFFTYVVVLHIAFGWLLWDPSLVSRIAKYVRKSPAEQPEYRGMVAAHEIVTRSLPQGATVFLGDSRMKDLDVATIVEGPVYNLSIGGDTTRGLSARLKYYHRLDRCKALVLGIGVNDLSHFSDEESLQQYEQILSFLRESAVRRVVVCSILPIDEAVYHQANSAWLRGYRTTNARIVGYNSKLRELCDRYAFAQFVDVTSDLADSSGNLFPGFSGDGLHLLEAGSRAWASALKRMMALHAPN
jgi:lysophospholipase L1-like esterase